MVTNHELQSKYETCVSICQLSNDVKPEKIMSVLVLSTSDECYLEEAKRIGSYINELTVSVSDKGQMKALREGCRANGGSVTGLKVECESDMDKEYKEYIVKHNTMLHESKHYDSFAQCTLTHVELLPEDTVLLMPGAPVTAQLCFQNALNRSFFSMYKHRFIIYDPDDQYKVLREYLKYRAIETVTNMDELLLLLKKK